MSRALLPVAPCPCVETKDWGLTSVVPGVVRCSLPVSANCQHGFFCHMPPPSLVVYLPVYLPCCTWYIVFWLVSHQYHYDSSSFSSLSKLQTPPFHPLPPLPHIIHMPLSSKMKMEKKLTWLIPQSVSFRSPTHFIRQPPLFHVPPTSPSQPPSRDPN